MHKLRFRNGTAHMLAAVVLAVFLATAPPVAALLPGPYPRIFKTEPSFVPSAIKVTEKTNERDLFEPGYYFIAPHIKMIGYGPQIVDQDANLVWYGEPSTRAHYAGNFYACDYLGQMGNHLCWGEIEGVGERVLTNEYRPAVKPFNSIHGRPGPDIHEFNMLPGGKSYVTVVNRLKTMDLRPYKGGKKGLVRDGCLQEVDVRTRKELFFWCFLDHFPIHETFLYLEGNKVNASTASAGKGVWMSPWDFLHANAVDKNSEGDYMISGRHTSQVVKIAGRHNRRGLKPGKIIWRLGGRHSDFKFPQGKSAMFGRQHHCRFVQTGRNEEIITVFNNAYEPSLHVSKPESEGMILRLNNETMEAFVDKAYPYGMSGHRSMAQGSMVILPQTKNALVGWGQEPEWSEYTPNGTRLFHAIVHANTQGILGNYRAFKAPWVGRPRTKPKVIVYCQTCQAFPSKSKDSTPLMAYVSWNGATEVKSWRFHLSATTKIGPWFPAGTFPRDGFETRAELKSIALDKVASFAPWVTVEALAANGSVIATVMTRTWVPSKKIENINGKCGRKGCTKPKRFDYNKKYNISSTCSVDWTAVIIVAALVGVLIETINGFLTTSVERSVGPKYERIWNPDDDI